jgi:hypothetical protein
MRSRTKKLKETIRNAVEEGGSSCQIYRFIIFLMSIPANKTNKRVIEKLTKNRSNLTRVRSRELKKTNYRTKTRLIPSESRSRSTTIITKAIKRGGLLADSEREIERGQCRTRHRGGLKNKLSNMEKEQISGILFF